MFRTKFMTASQARRSGSSGKRGFAFGLLLVCVLGAGCRRDMQDQPTYEIYESSDFFKDGQASRPIPEGTVPRGYLREDAHLYTGRVPGGGASGGGAGNSQSVAASGNNSTSDQVANREDGGAAGDGVASPGAAATAFDADLVKTFPFPITREILDRGQERFQAFCVMCHGLTGEGDGMVVRRGYKRPTSYHDDRLRQAPVGHFFDVITNGYGVMPNYAAQITPRDRWAIAAYLRALQLSRGAKLEDLPEAERRQLEGGNTMARKEDGRQGVGAAQNARNEQGIVGGERR